jgi:hydrogenase maturation protease
MLLIGCGNRNRGDDGAGVLVAERLRELGMHAEVCTGEALALIETWSGFDDVVLVDAVVTGAPAGTVWRWEGPDLKIHDSSPVSTHGFGVAEAIKLAHILGRLPKRLRVFGIEGRQFDVGSDVSPEALRAVEELTRQITEEATKRPSPVVEFL